MGGSSVVAKCSQLEAEANKMGSTLKTQSKHLEDDFAVRNSLATLNLEGQKSTHLLDTLRSGRQILRSEAKIFSGDVED